MISDAATRFLGGRVLQRESPEECVLALERFAAGLQNMSNHGAQRMAYNSRSPLDRVTQDWPSWKGATK